MATKSRRPGRTLLFLTCLATAALVSTRFASGEQLDSKTQVMIEWCRKILAELIQQPVTKPAQITKGQGYYFVAIPVERPWLVNRGELIKTVSCTFTKRRIVRYCSGKICFSTDIDVDAEIRKEAERAAAKGQEKTK